MPLLSLPQLFLVATGLIVCSLVIGFVSGCEYKEDQIAKEKLAEVKENARLEKKDGVEGANAVNALRKIDNQIYDTAKAIVGETSNKPLVIVKTKPTVCPVSTVVSKDSNDSPAIKEPVNEEPTVVYLSKHFMRLHDLSAQPGNTQFRAGTYEAARELRIDEGLGVVARNNLQCVAWKSQLDALINRIEQKRKLFGQSDKE